MSISAHYHPLAQVRDQLLPRISDCKHFVSACDAIPGLCDRTTWASRLHDDFNIHEGGEGEYREKCNGRGQNLYMILDPEGDMRNKNLHRSVRDIRVGDVLVEDSFETGYWHDKAYEVIDIRPDGKLLARERGIKLGEPLYNPESELAARNTIPNTPFKITDPKGRKKTLPPSNVYYRMPEGLVNSEDINMYY